MDISLNWVVLARLNGIIPSESPSLSKWRTNTLMAYYWSNMISHVYNPVVIFIYELQGQNVIFYIYWDIMDYRWVYIYFMIHMCIIISTCMLRPLYSVSPVPNSFCEQFGTFRQLGTDFRQLMTFRQLVTNLYCWFIMFIFSTVLSS